MSRIENSSQEDLEKKINLLEKKIKKGGRRIFSCLSCLTYLLFIIIFFVIGFVYFVAKSGISDVPILTERLYQPPTFVHQVPFMHSQSTLIEQLQQKTQGVFTREVREVMISLDLYEEVLTEELHKKLEAQEGIRVAQIAVTQEYIEVFLDKNEVIIIVRALPVIKKGNLRLEIVSVQVGQVVLWDWIGKGVVSWGLQGVTGALSTLVTPFGKVDKVSLDQGLVRFDVRVHYSSQLLHAF